MLLTTILLAQLTTPSAEAGIYGGNPQIIVRVDRPQHDLTDGNVTLGKVRMHTCGGGTTDYPVGAVIDPVAGYAVAIGAGDWCAATFFWDDYMVLDGDGQAGAFTVEYRKSATFVQVDPWGPPVALTPYYVVSGTMYSGAPALIVSIE